MNQNAPVETNGAQPAGDPRYELLRDPWIGFLTDTTNLGESLAKEYQGTILGTILPSFDHKLFVAREKAKKGQYRRSEMPVIDEVDLEDLKADLLLTGIAAEPNCVITIGEAQPSQCQIYVDKSITNTIKNGVTKTLEFLGANHLVITQDNFIVDGHHRWLSGALISDDFILPAFRIPMDYIEARPQIMRFSDSRHLRNL